MGINWTEIIKTVGGGAVLLAARGLVDKEY